MQIKLVDTMALILLCRLPILCVLLMELKDFRVIIHTGKRMFSPFMTFIFSLLLMIVFFKSIGIISFNGLIRTDDQAVIASTAGNPLYYLLNFNDTYSGLLTLFSILVSNNWG